ncbi:hypothetical protein SAY87_011246 [Trapa incisa]|uniref:Uncharacterized protein n=1 Tax=Trapa incisa TaxID=236973 RepID=A0AAN7GMM9_9MYRT|nr:hypothetical protein SAY87_011246 [Trapa incisa]
MVSVFLLSLFCSDVSVCHSVLGARLCSFNLLITVVSWSCCFVLLFLLYCALSFYSHYCPVIPPIMFCCSELPDVVLPFIRFVSEWFKYLLFSCKRQLLNPITIPVFHSAVCFCQEVQVFINFKFKAFFFVKDRSDSLSLLLRD